MTIIDYLRHSAQIFPDKTAFADEQRSLTYRELETKVNSIATALIARVMTANRPIAVLIDRNVESVCAFLGIAMSRNFYVPIDITQPKQRILTILGQMQPEAVISIGNLTEELKPEITIPVFEYAELLQTERELL